MTTSIEHVSDTAFWVAHYRWLETQRKDALFHDPLALKLIGDRGKKIAKHMGIQTAMAWSMSLRTRIIDDYIAEAIAGGVDCIVNLGAGLDTRPYRLNLPADFPWVEVDFPQMIAYKDEVLANDKPICHLERIGCDLSQDAERLALLEGLSRAGHNILVLTEGVIPYLSNESAATLADNLHQQDHITAWITDYFSPFFTNLTARTQIQSRLAKNAPFLFNPGDDILDWPRFFAAAGWQIHEMRYTGEVGKTLGRDLPGNGLTRFLMQFAPEERLRPYRRMSGYALLNKGREVVPV